MSRTLYLMRHAQAEGSHAGGDRLRPLSRRGREQAREAGSLLATARIDLALVSSATRARQTFEGLGLRRDGGAVPAEYLAALYNSGTGTLLQRIGETPEEVGALLVIAHAPGIPSLAANLTWASSRRESDLLQCGFPTATFAGFAVECPWAELAGFDPFDYTDPGRPRECPVRPLGAPRAPAV